MPFLSAIVDRARLTKALAQIQRIVEKRNTIPILAHFLIEARGDGLTFRATDLDIEATVTVPAEIQQPGEITVMAHLLGDIVRKLEAPQISITVEEPGGNLAVRAGRSRFNLQTLPAADFPELQSGKYESTFSLTGDELCSILESGFASSTEETRYYLNGVYFHTVTNGNMLSLRGVATDGHRLARIGMQSPEGASAMPGVILPRKAVGELMKLAAGAKTVEIAISKTKARFAVGEVVMTTKLIDGTFPDYGRVVPTGNDRRLVVDKDPFMQAVDRVGTLSSERGRSIKLSIADGWMTLSVNNPDSGSASEEIEVDYDSPPMDIGFNANYLTGILDQIEGKRVRMMLADPGSPTLLTSDVDDSALYVLMPLRV